MCVSKPRITIVGLGLVGGSLGLALRRSGAAGSILGHDRNRLVSNEAKNKGAVDQVHWNLISACEEADLIILALPLDAILETREAIGPHLRPGCVVMDTAAVKQPVMDWAAEYLPQEVHFVGTDPVLARIIAAGGDRFDGVFLRSLNSSLSTSAAISATKAAVSKGGWMG